MGLTREAVVDGKTVRLAECDQCGQEFVPKRINKDGPMYCRNACRQKAHKLRMQETRKQAAQGISEDGERIEQAIGEVLQLGLNEFKSRKRKDELGFMLLESRLAAGFRDLLRKETAQVKDRLLVEKDSEVAYQRDRADRYYEWLEESREFNRRMMGAIGTLRNRAVGGVALTAADWDELKEMTDSELRRWVTIGARMDKNPSVNNPAEQAKRWVVENRPAIAPGE